MDHLRCPSDITKFGTNENSGKNGSRTWLPFPNKNYRTSKFDILFLFGLLKERKHLSWQRCLRSAVVAVRTAAAVDFPSAVGVPSVVTFPAFLASLLLPVYMPSSSLLLLASLLLLLFHFYRFLRPTPSPSTVRSADYSQLHCTNFGFFLRHLTFALASTFRCCLCLLFLSLSMISAVSAVWYLSCLLSKLFVAIRLCLCCLCVCLCCLCFAVYFRLSVLYGYFETKIFSD